MTRITALSLKKESVKFEKPACKICQKDICPKSKSKFEIPWTKPTFESQLIVGT
ncbi:hypothetical protein HNP69_001371 [Chryseobacterium koreense]|nr:hypothetical protein [Chryseobacterium koreense]MBB5333247.1 hypothetical protein [Chryseobacterium koreense]